ncbi:16315_t:CDS:2 [Entrophospora sp. SA101]|nr:16311_t:CDS:2 [Entrophospora sp. SA101]CAJ0827719.1 16315_t:CDS:2 [Entrophospora sp. SA101]
MKDHQVTKKSSDSSSNKSSSSINATAEFELNSFVTIDTTIDYEDVFDRFDLEELYTPSPLLRYLEQRCI